MKKLSNNDFKNLDEIRIDILKQRIANCEDIELLESLEIPNALLSYERYKRLLILKDKPFKEAQFITIGQTNCNIVSLMVYKDGYIRPINNNSINKVKSLLNFDFNVIFNNDRFDGASFELALYMAGYCLKNNRTVKDHLVFSGVIHQNKVLTAYFDKKQKCAQKANKKLIGNISLEKAVIQSLNPKSLIIWASKDTLNVAFEPVMVGELKKRGWKNAIIKAASQIPPGCSIAFRCPATFAFGVGAKLGSTYSYEVLHFANGQYQGFTTSRKLKEIDGNTSLLEIEGNIGKIVNLTIHIASHQPGFAPVDESNVLVKTKTTGNIPISEYEEIVRQINNCINNIRKQNIVEHFNIVLSMPVAMAFALGWAVGKFIPASVYQYFVTDNKYCKVFDVNRL